MMEFSNPPVFFLNYLQICSLLRGGIAERGGVRVGHRIIEINGQSVVAVPHEKIVNLLATSVGEVRIYIVYTVLSIFYRKRCKQYGARQQKKLVKFNFTSFFFSCNDIIVKLRIFV